MKILIIAAGTPISLGLLKLLVQRADRCICADSGAEIFRKAGLIPDGIIGDFDSVSPETLRHYRETGKVEIIRLEEQETTDLEKALNLALKWGGKAITISCISGGRGDHFLNALGLLIKYKDDAAITIVDDYNTIKLRCSPFTENCRPGERISIIPWGVSRVEDVVTEGLEYPLNHEDLISGLRESISNRTSGNSFTVDFKSGILLLFRSIDSLWGDGEAE